MLSLYPLLPKVGYAYFSFIPTLTLPEVRVGYGRTLSVRTWYSKLGTPNLALQTSFGPNEVWSTTFGPNEVWSAKFGVPSFECHGRHNPDLDSVQVTGAQKGNSKEVK